MLLTNDVRVASDSSPEVLTQGRGGRDTDGVAETRQGAGLLSECRFAVDGFAVRMTVVSKGASRWLSRRPGPRPGTWLPIQR